LLRKIFGHKREDVVVGRREIHDEEFVIRQPAVAKTLYLGPWRVAI
jgi:hypothetical protein